MMKTKRIVMAGTSVLMVLVLAFVVTGCGVVNICDDCSKTFVGTAYYNPFQGSSSTMCKDCAIDYFGVFGIDNYKK